MPSRIHPLTILPAALLALSLAFGHAAEPEPTNAGIVSVSALEALPFADEPSIQQNEAVVGITNPDVDAVNVVYPDGATGYCRSVTGKATSTKLATQVRCWDGAGLRGEAFLIDTGGDRGTLAAALAVRNGRVVIRFTTSAAGSLDVNKVQEGEAQTAILALSATLYRTQFAVTPR